MDHTNSELLCIGHIQLDILSQPNPLTHTIVIGQPQVQDSSIPALISPKASTKAGSYIFQFLKELADSGNYHELVSMTKPDITNGFQEQWSAFIHGQYPFLPPTNNCITPFQYWLDLRANPKAFLVAVCAQLFPNSSNLNCFQISDTCSCNILSHTQFNGRRTYSLKNYLYK